MSLPWFPFNIKDFLANTLRLNTEATGAYLRLMLDYYQGEEALPDDDDVLAAIAGLPIESWNRHRKVLAPLFEIRDGCWYHARIAEEIERGNAKLASSKARAEAGAAAMHTKYGHKPASSQPRARSKPITGHKPASSQPEAVLEDSSTAAHLHKHTTLSNERVVPAAPNDDARQAQNGLGEGQASQARPPEPADNPLGTVLPESWLPDALDIDFAKQVGMDDATIHDEVLMFHRLNSQNGTFSKNWKATWEIFCTRWKQRQPPAPRVDVSASVTDSPSERAAYVPRPIEYERALTRWATGDENGWPRNLLGPDPSQRGCRVPKEYLDKFNIDENGRVRPARKEAS